MSRVAHLIPPIDRRNHLSSITGGFSIHETQYQLRIPNVSSLNILNQNLLNVKLYFRKLLNRLTQPSLAQAEIFVELTNCLCKHFPIDNELHIDLA